MRIGSESVQRCTAGGAECSSRARTMGDIIRQAAAVGPTPIRGHCRRMILPIVLALEEHSAPPAVHRWTLSDPMRIVETVEARHRETFGHGLRDRRRRIQPTQSLVDLLQRRASSCLSLNSDWPAHGFY
jgi:hypothetical protein